MRHVASFLKVGGGRDSSRTSQKKRVTFQNPENPNPFLTWSHRIQFVVYTLLRSLPPPAMYTGSMMLFNIDVVFIIAILILIYMMIYELDMDSRMLYDMDMVATMNKLFWIWLK